MFGLFISFAFSAAILYNSAMSDEFDLFDDLEEEAETPYLLFSVGKRLFAVEALQTREMVKLPDTVPVPEQPPWVRGIMSLREKHIGS